MLIQQCNKVPFYPKYSTTDHWIQESMKGIFNSGLFWAVEAAERKKSKLP